MIISIYFYYFIPICSIVLVAVPLLSHWFIVGFRDLERMEPMEQGARNTYSGISHFLHG